MITGDKGLVGGIQRFSTSDGPGIRTTVFLKGCPLSCAWCHNPELINPKVQLMRSTTKCIGCGYCLNYCPQKAIKQGEDGFFVDRKLCDNCLACVEACTAEAMTPVGELQSVGQVMETVLKDKGFYEKSGGGMTISGGELLMQKEFAKGLLEAACKANIDVALDTSGFGDGEFLAEMAKTASHILFDMKCIIDKGHMEYTGVSNSKILQNLARLCRDEAIRDKIIMRMPLIHGINDTEEVINATAKFYKENHLKQVTLLAYHELGKSKCKSIGREFQGFTPPPHERMEEIKKTFQAIGMQTEILGEDIA